MNNEEQETKEQMEAFLADYKELCTKHKMAFQPALDISQGGITPIIQIVKPK